MTGARLRIPYRQRILHYCRQHGIVVPKGFDAPKSSERYALVDVSVEPNLLYERTACMERDVIRVVDQARNTGRAFRILDFKRGVELQHDGGTRLAKVGAFECAAPGELLSLVEPAA